MDLRVMESAKRDARCDRMTNVEVASQAPPMASDERTHPGQSRRHSTYVSSNLRYNRCLMALFDDNGCFRELLDFLLDPSGATAGEGSGRRQLDDIRLDSKLA